MQVQAKVGIGTSGGRRSSPIGRPITPKYVYPPDTVALLLLVALELLALAGLRQYFRHAHGG